MSHPRTTHRTEHTITVAAPARRVFGLIVDVGRWPETFPPTVHVERVEHTEHAGRSTTEERIRIWATANGAVKAWTSRRELDHDRLRVTFRQEVSQPPVAAMGGEWIVEALDDAHTRVRLLHDFRAVGDDPDNIAWIERAIDRNSGAELDALRTGAERTGDAEALTLTFEDTVEVDGDTAAAYAFVDRADLWPARLPHVARAVLEEEVPGIQSLEMETVTPDGSTHTTRSVRICFPDERIVYKQLHTPALMAAHTGRWLFERDTAGARITSVHTVVLDEKAITEVLGPDATVADARAFVRGALGRNSTTTMEHAAAHAREAAPDA
ncbi:MULTISPECIES: aromatase/cyclase [unclassified Streptomyces]|uniref:aromatase/cyclase n=1 Tax=unclassified Streptomyces TaxID=2593676 RepID=UPI0006FA78C0|nr:MULTISPECIES: aromatase/cyclase [unclassified Streptomyces]KQX56327.1 cyclase [Streptomyces sp. Root1304]KRA97142.1 cyclase [Streptomyces sp. Root66D1]